MAHISNYDPRDRRAERRTQIWIAVISALSGIAVALITLVGTLRATDSQIVTGPATAGTTVTQTVTVAPTTTITETVAPSGQDGEGTSSGSQPSAAETPLDVNWTTTLGKYRGRIGLAVLFDCPPRGLPQTIWGDRVYTGDSSVCTAAVHDGRINLDEGGRVTVVVREGATEYKASRRNGITSQEYGRYGSSFEFLPPR